MTRSQEMLQQTLSRILENPARFDARTVGFDSLAGQYFGSTLDWAGFVLEVSPEVKDAWARHQGDSEGDRNLWDLIDVISEILNIPDLDGDDPIIEHLNHWSRTVDDICRATSAFCDPIAASTVTGMNFDELWIAACRPDLPEDAPAAIMADGPWSTRERSYLSALLPWGTWSDDWCEVSN